MDFMVGLSRCQSGYDAIWVNVDRLMALLFFRWGFHLIGMQANFTAMFNWST